MIKNRFLSLFLILFLFISFIKADTTFFDNEEDVFIIGNPPITSNEITGIIKENELNGDGSCLTNWICSDWSSCINGIQQRNCAKEKSYCYADLNEKPDENQKCFSEKQNETQEPTQNKEKDKKIKILIFVLTLFAVIILFAYKIFRKIRHNKYGY